MRIRQKALVIKGKQPLLRLISMGTALLMLLAFPVSAELLKKSPGRGTHFYPVTESDIQAVRGCSVYVPAYSHIYLSEDSHVPLAVTLSVRNINPAKRLIIKDVNYFDSTGKKLDSLIKGWFALAPMATATFVIDQQDLTGGAGANFIVQWASENAAQEPLIEAVMAGYRGTKGLGFTSRSVKLLPCE